MAKANYSTALCNLAAHHYTIEDYDYATAIEESRIRFNRATWKSLATGSYLRWLMSRTKTEKNQERKKAYREALNIYISEYRD